MVSIVPTPGTKAPNLNVPRLGGGRINLSRSEGSATVVLFYSGVASERCREQVEELAMLRGEFGLADVDVVAVSMDSHEDAQRQRRHWNIDGLAVGYGLGEINARVWGLFVEEAVDGATSARCQPGIAVVGSDGMIDMLFVQSVPFARPSLGELLDGLSSSIGGRRSPSRPCMAERAPADRLDGACL